MVLPTVYHIIGLFWLQKLLSWICETIDRAKSDERNAVCFRFESKLTVKLHLQTRKCANQTPVTLIMLGAMYQLIHERSVKSNQ